MAEEKNYDLFVIGAGSGGVSASRRAAVHGAKVGICENYRVGGTCVIRGCVPKKLLVYASHYAEDFHEAKGFGWDIADAKFSWSKLIENKDKEIDRLNQIYINMLDKGGVELINGAASFIDANTVKIISESGEETIVKAKKFLIATGASPFYPELPGIEHAISSNEAFHLKALPKSVAIVGGGYIAVEFAGIFNALGSKVTQLYRGEKILRGFDEEMRDHLSNEIKKKGIDLRLNTNVTEIIKSKDAYTLKLTDGSSLEVEQVMYATGRKPNISALNLESIGIKTAKNGAIEVNEFSQTSVQNIFAIGDVTDRMNLTPVAINEGRAFADTEYAKTPRSMDYENIASAVFSQPSLACCGLTEEEAKAKYGSLKIYISEFRPMKHTLSGSDERAIMKLIVDKASDRVLGAHMVGADAAEIMQGISIAMKCNATKAQFDSTVAIHPSSAEEFVIMRSVTREV